MPATEEIKGLHTKTPEKIYEREVKEIWKRENPGRPENDYYFKPEEQTWRKDTKARLEEFDNRCKLDISNLPTLAKLDQSVGSTLEPNKAEDPAANKTYVNLHERFGETALRRLESIPLPTEMFTEFKLLVQKTDEQVQRNSADLAGVVATTMDIAQPELDKLKGELAASEIVSALGELRDDLKDWDQLLAAQPLPDPDVLKAIAAKLDHSFNRVYDIHRQCYDVARTRNEVVPFVKYQLLATMRSLSEKTASQFGSRLGNGSFSAAYDLIRDVPVRGTTAASQTRSAKLAQDYPATSGPGWDFKKGFQKERKDFLKDIKTSIKQHWIDLDPEFQKINKACDAAFDKWRKAYVSVGSGDLRTARAALSELCANTAELGFYIRKYREAVDSVLGESKSSTVQGARDKYQQTLDGFVASIATGVLISKNLLS